MSRASWVTHFGLTRMPFSKSIAAADLFPRAAHAEAVARIGFCIVEGLLGVVVDDVGCGKTVAVRAAAAGLDRTRHQVIYISKPSGLAVSTSPSSPLSAGCPATASRSSSPRPPTCSPPRRPSATVAWSS